jgi:UDP-3-O-[3-hydroxymyristoyl] N-acetylglucosamine deacetylase/3-hydroxyacyl-[acyl-carrier-protein] dehydratase
MEKQHTLNHVASLSGVGLHSGLMTHCSIHPAPENTGIIFRRNDVEGGLEIPADVDFVVETNRGTVLGKDGHIIQTVEHLMAAFSGLKIDNAIVEIDGPEIPILDGSAMPYVKAILEAGIIEQDAERKYFIIPTSLSCYDEEKKSEIIGFPSAALNIQVHIDFNSSVVLPQEANYHTEIDFKDEISKARTFVFLHEIEHLIERKLIKGGDLSNAIVFVEKELSEEKLDFLADFFQKSKMKVNEGNMLNHVELFYSNEPARHKLLDLMGDLALAGMPIKGNIVASRPGHQTNIAFAKKIKQMIKDEKAGKTMPYIDLTQTLYDIHQIMEFLPHRYPFLLVDRIVELKGDTVVGIKNVTMNEPFFTGHFPGNPVMPGVLQIEAMAQVGGILAMNSVDDYKLYTPYFIKIESVKFKQKVLPGDTLVFILQLLSPIRRGICHMGGKAYVDGKLVMEAEMMAQLIKNQ